MAFRNSIGTRILGLALFLLALTIALVAFLLSQVASMHRELRALTQFDIPLASSLSRVDEFGLRRRLAFERMFGALNLATPDESIMTESQANYEKFTGLMQGEFEKAKKLIAADERGGTDTARLAEFDTLLRQVEAAYVPIGERQKAVLDLQRRGEHERANLVAEGLDDLQRLVQTQRAELQNGSARRAETIARDTLARQQRIMWLSVGATTSTVLLGLLVAMLVTKALVRPVQSLIGALNDVQHGKLDLDLPVRSSDELGALTASFNYFVQELRAKAAMKETFGKYVDPRILDRVLDANIAADAAGGREVMTVAFGDLVGFTSMSERLTPANMVRLLNRHFGLQAQAVQDHQGIVDKFIGDSIMAFWGPPFVSDSDHAVRACRAALAQLDAIDILRRELPELTGLRRDTPAIDLRIGLATGEVIVGNIGSENTRSFTVIGDTVNLAARLEAANRFYGTRILVSENVARDAGPQFEMRELDAIAVKGKIEPVQIFELLGPVGCLDDTAQRARDAFAEGLRAYRAAEWAVAHKAFTASLALVPADPATQIMLERVALLREQPTGSEWDGVWRMETK
jgi:adenylate cyclase